MSRAFLERERELEQLEHWFAEVESSRAGRLVLVAGEAGIGKSTLVRHFVAGRRAYRGACDPLATPAPLGPFVEVAAQVGGRAAEAVSRAARPYEVGRALLDELEGAETAMVVLEDLHWADQGTIDALVYLGRRVERVPALVVATCRDELGEPHPLRAAFAALATAGRLERLPLERLSPGAVDRLAAAAGRDGEEVYAATRGNPFFVGELLASPPGAVPASVRDVVLARVAELDDAERGAVELVAVVPQQAEARLVEVLDVPAGVVERCVAAGVLERPTETTVAFRHELARLAVEQALGPERAVVLHRLVLAALEGRGVEPARLAHHAERAHDREALLRHATAAARHAAQLGAHREAADHYARALSVASDRAELLSGYAFELYLTDRLDEAIDAQREAVAILRAAGDRRAEGDGLRLLSRVLWFGGRNEESEEAALEAVAVLERLPADEALARAFSNVSQLRMLAYDTEAAIDWGGRALELAERCQAADVAVHALTNIGSAEFYGGSEPAGRAKLEAALARAAALGLEDDVGRAYANLATGAVERRQTALAARYLSDGIAYTDDHDLLSYGLYLRAWRARLALDSGRWSEAARIAEEVLAHPKASAPTRILASVVGGLLAVRTGEAERGERLLEDALALARPTGELQRLGPVAAARAEAAWLRGDAAGVDEATRAVVALAADRGQRWPFGELAVWRLRAGLHAAAGPAAPPAEAELRGDFDGAARLWADLGCPYDAALALAASDEERALRRALGELQRLGAVAGARVVARRLRERGVRDLPRGPYGAARRNPARLTARELEVLDLLAQSLRNAEIAQRLVVSRRTVDHHVSQILSKLGVSSRAEAALAARELGLAKDR